MAMHNSNGENENSQSAYGSSSRKRNSRAVRMSVIKNSTKESHVSQKELAEESSESSHRRQDHLAQTQGN